MLSAEQVLGLFGFAHVDRHTGVNRKSGVTHF